MRHTIISTATIGVFLISMLAINLVMAQEELPVEEIGFGQTQEIFTKPKDKKTEDYITGRFG